MRPQRQTAIPFTGLILLTTLGLTTACAGRTAPKSTATSPALVDVSELWVDPGNIEDRDLFHGPGGVPLAPAEGGTYDLVAEDARGFSPGYDVRDPAGTVWSVKTGPEAQSEVVSSRILWAIGYHQPASYLVKEWALAGKQPVNAGPARFRREQPAQKVVSEWSWYENPFVGTREYRGLLVANLVLNNWDWKTSNNKVYEVTDGGRVQRVYVVRDLGASLGRTSFPAMLRWTPFRLMAQGSRNDIDDFEEQHLIKARNGDDLEFDYHGVHPRLVNMLTVADVEWTCRLLARISDRQWQDIFRAAGYEPADGQRFIAHLKAKIEQGIAAATDPAFRAPASQLAREAN